MHSLQLVTIRYFQQNLVLLILENTTESTKCAQFSRKHNPADSVNLLQIPSIPHDPEDS